jgi:pilus assembly protein TadC
MSTKMLYSAIGVWLGLVTVIVVIGLAAGVPLTLATSVLVLVVGVVPPAIVFKLFGRQEAQSVAEMLRQ